MGVIVCNWRALCPGAKIQANLEFYLPNLPSLTVVTETPIFALSIQLIPIKGGNRELRLPVPPSKSCAIEMHILSISEFPLTICHIVLDHPRSQDWFKCDLEYTKKEYMKGPKGNLKSFSPLFTIVPSLFNSPSASQIIFLVLSLLLFRSLLAEDTSGCPANIHPLVKSTRTLFPLPLWCEGSLCSFPLLLLHIN